VPIVDYPYSLLRGLSDFWTRFFADADQLDALYRGTIIQLGQAYLDLLSSVLSVSLKDAIVLDREYYQLIAIREDEVSFSSLDNRWTFDLPDPVVSFASLDNRVVEPTASLEPNLDLEVVDRVVRFHVDPTDPAGDGSPLVGFARRALDVAVGGRFFDPGVADWRTTGVRKGDVVRILDVGSDGTQRRRADYSIILTRLEGLYVAPDAPLPTGGSLTSINYAVLRVPQAPRVIAEAFTLSSSAATLAHTRVDVGSVRVFAKAPDGSDVVEGVDYVINYEQGLIVAVTSWIGMISGAGTFSADYFWRAEVRPASGPSPRLATNGAIGVASTARVLQIALWAPDARVDRRTLANNFGSLIGRSLPSTEAYRAFLAGIFQLYVLGPVLERIESALNVVLGYPVVRDDEETFLSVDTSDPKFDRVLTSRPPAGLVATYTFPKGTPFRSDLVSGLVLESFSPLTTVVSVVDWVQSPDWWHGAVIPEQMFGAVDGARPTISRRTASPFYVEHLIGASDGPVIGDPGLVIGADETGFIPPPGQPVLRHRLAFVLMDQYLKYHTFSIKFNAIELAAAVGDALPQSLKDLNELVLTARPSHTFPFTTPETFFRDEIQALESTISFNRLLGSRVFGPDKVVYADAIPVIGAGIWSVGDYFKYEFSVVTTSFPSVGVPVALTGAPVAPRHGRLVIVHLAGSASGRALVENLDYFVSYGSRTVMRLTAWASNTVNVTYRQLNIGNLADGPKGIGDMPLLISGVDPALTTAAFDPAAAGWDGTANPPTAPRDLGMVERALIVSPH
jgi:hypothetical protein